MSNVITEREGIERLLDARKRNPNFWATLEPELIPEFRNLFGQIHGEGRSVLEIGSGHGFTCILFALWGAREVHGIDVVPPAVEFATRLAREMDPDLPVSFRCHDAAEPLPFEDQSLDAVLMVEVISHIVFANLESFLREIVRVLRPGGVVCIYDGNNARSPIRRRINYEIWRRFDQGPPTRGDETVHTHRIKHPYVEVRREIVLDAVPSLSEDEARQIAERSFRYTEDEVRDAARRFVEMGTLPDSPFRPKVCPIEPRSRMYIEELIDPFEVAWALKRLGCRVTHAGARRRLPLAAFWDRVPALTFRFTNGFVLIAEKR